MRPRLLGVAAAALAVAGVSGSAYDANVGNDLAYIAGAAYCDAAPVTSWSCAACVDSPIALSDVHFFEDSGLNNFAFTAVDSGDGAVYVSWRGSADIETWINNLKFGACSWKANAVKHRVADSFQRRFIWPQRDNMSLLCLSDLPSSFLQILSRA